MSFATCLPITILLLGLSPSVLSCFNKRSILFFQLLLFLEMPVLLCREMHLHSKYPQYAFYVKINKGFQCPFDI